MILTLYLMTKMSREFDTKIRVDLWSYNEALVKRIQKLIDHDPISMCTKNDQDLYSRIKKDVQVLRL